jgi:hypothetical protein
VLHTNIEPDLPKRGLNGIMRSTIAACAILVLLIMGRPVTPHNSNSQQSRAGMPVQSATETASVL